MTPAVITIVVTVIIAAARVRTCANRNRLAFAICSAMRQTTRTIRCRVAAVAARNTQLRVTAKRAKNPKNPPTIRVKH